MSTTVKPQKQKAILLENGNEWDIPEEIIEYAKQNNISWKHKNVREIFYHSNRAKTYQYFKNLPDGQVFICQTVFHGFMQLELFIELLYELKDKKFTFKIYCYSICQDFEKWYEKYEAETTPDTQLYDDHPFLREKFKKDLNKKFREVLSSHNIIWINNYIKDIRLRTIARIKTLASKEK